MSSYMYTILSILHTCVSFLGVRVIGVEEGDEGEVVGEDVPTPLEALVGDGYGGVEEGGEGEGSPSVREGELEVGRRMGGVGRRMWMEGEEKRRTWVGEGRMREVGEGEGWEWV